MSRGSDTGCACTRSVSTRTVVAASSAREELERAVAETKRVYADSRRAYRSAMAERDADASTATDAVSDLAADDTRADDAPAAG